MRGAGRNSYTIVDGQTTILLHFRLGLGLARVQLFGVRFQMETTGRGRSKSSPPSGQSAACRCSLGAGRIASHQGPGALERKSMQYHLNELEPCVLIPQEGVTR